MQPIKCLNSRSGRMWMGLLLGLMLAHGALAADPYAPEDIYGGTNAIYDYTVPGNPPPQFDATNFIINGSFTINFTTFTINDELYEPLDVVNYVNNGTMAANTGFQFNTQTASGNSPYQMAGSFFNGGSIYCASYTDTNVAFFFGLSLEGLYAGEFIASATNIVNPGVVDVGTGGLIQFTGQNVNLSHGLYTVEAFDAFDTFYNPGLVSVDYGVGTDTNKDWEPAFDLTATTARSSLFNSQLFAFNQMYLPSSTSYFYIVQPATNYVIYRSIFLNNNPGVNVTNNVYFGGDAVGAGAAHIEWVGTYTDPATGLPANNYLYLSDYYLGAANTNNPIIAPGIPSNFTIAEGAQEFFGVPPAVAGFTNVFSPGIVTNNNYSYVSVLLTPTTVVTNSPSPNVTNNLAILAGRMQVSASQELNLAGADISGPNYLSLSAPNQFDGSPGAQIFTPYTDLNLGVTNGFMTVSNLLEPALPRWSGAVQAWSSDWIYVDPFGVTNDYRVLIVNAQLQPTTASQVQNLALHSTNSVVISDVLNILNTFYIDAPNLTLTTNGTSAGSPEGQLNLENLATSFSSSTLPNLRCLTNNGALSSQNSTTFGAPSANYTAFVNNGLISDQGTSIYTGYFENSGSFLNGVGSFLLQSQAATLTNGMVTAGLDVSIATGSLVTSNAVIQAGRSLTITATNQLADTGPTNGGIWTVGSVANNGISGFNVLANPANGDLLGTTVTNIAPNNVTVVNTWAGRDFGTTTAGYSNNVAIGRLILDSPTDISQPSRYGLFQFNGTGASNAIYVDYLELRDAATGFSSDSNGRVYTALNFNPNLVIYYAQAFVNGQSQALALNHANDNHLRWVPAYAGYFSSTNIVYPNGTTNAINAALASDPGVDSDGDGKVNSQDSTPLFVSSEVGFTLSLTNVPPLKVKITWDSIPASTNYVLYRTNLLSTNWVVLTNFVSPSAVPPAGGWPITNSVYDTVNPAVQKFYRVHVDPNSSDLYGPGF